MRTHVSLVFLATLATTAQAQTLNVQPARFADPRPGTQAKHGEVVLGRTTLKGALRMFAEELNADSVAVARGHAGNPGAIPSATVWQVGARQVQPRQHLDLGPDRYSLWFDESGRLVAASTTRVPLGLTRTTLVDHYRAIQRGRRWNSGDQPSFDVWTVPVDSCVALSAQVSVATERLEQLSYIYTCPTGPLSEIEGSVSESSR